MTKLVDSYIQSAMILQHIPGLALAVMQNGKPIILKGYGHANLEHKVPVSTNTLFQTGSLGQQFTATMALMLVEQGVLDLDARVGDYIEVPRDWAPITIRQLLSHTSGLHDYAFEINYRRDYTEQDLEDLLLSMPVVFTPGSEWSFSNTGYAVFGLVVKKMTGRSWRTFLQKQIFPKAGMKTACAVDDARIIPHRASGYVFRQEEICNQEWVPASIMTAGDGPSYVSIIDLANWERSLLTRRLLAPASKETMFAPTELDGGEKVGYGLGWHIGKINEQTVFEHGGTYQGFQAHICRYQNGKLTVAVLTNQLDARPELICHTVAGLISDKLRIAKTEPVESELPLASLEGTYKLTRGFPVQITASDGGIRLTYGGRITYQLQCAGRGIFVDDSGEQRLEFLLNADAQVSGFRRWASAAGGARSIANRVDG